MLGTILGFGGRIGRMRYFLLTLALAAAMTVLTLGLVFALASGSDVSSGEMSDGPALTIALVVLPIFLWASAALAAKRFRDIGWRPLYVIPGWVLVIVVDTAVALSVPALAIGDGDQTLLGLLTNLVMFGALLFWPGRDPDHAGPDMDALRRPYVEAAQRTVTPTPPAQPSARAPSGFGRRGI